ncbi:MAG: Fe-S cluster assembly protein SufD [Candidatus Sumerlaeota bacterium]|nr:Fe-S cluster assembly protein SufD [Candidatus Sumerlaeota bacterium]
MTDVLTKAEKFSGLFEQLRAATAGEPQWLTERRTRGFDSFAELGLPTQAMEEWRFTSLKPLQETEFTLAAPGAPVAQEVIDCYSYAGLEKHQLVFVDGIYHSELSSIAKLPKGVTLMPLRQAIVEKEDLVRQYLGRETNPDKHAFTALNDALMQDGVFLHVAAGAVAEEPIQLLFLTSERGAGTAANLRNLVILEESAEASFVETHAAAGTDAVYFTNAITEFFSAKNAKVDHYVIQRESTSAIHISSFHAYQERDSVVRSHTIDFGGGLVRHNLWGRLDGDACEAILNGLYMLRGNQHVDNFMWVEHMKEHIPSHELYKGILDDSSSAVFSGRIYVHREAQKTDAKQTNQNLLLTDTAKVNTKPQLEIYADDVKCTHGATIGQLDPQAQFYLESRGVPRNAARALLVKAFASDITERIRLESVRNTVENLLNERLGQDPES